MKNIGEELKYHRLQHNLTIQKLSDATGITISNLSRWENNVVLPNIGFCIELANYYNISIDELIGRDFK